MSRRFKPMTLDYALIAWLWERDLCTPMIQIRLGNHRALDVSVAESKNRSTAPIVIRRVIRPGQPAWHAFSGPQLDCRSFPTFFRALTGVLRSPKTAFDPLLAAAVLDQITDWHHRMTT